MPNHTDGLDAIRRLHRPQLSHPNKLGQQVPGREDVVSYFNTVHDSIPKGGVNFMDNGVIYGVADHLDDAPPADFARPVNSRRHREDKLLLSIPASEEVATHSAKRQRKRVKAREGRPKPRRAQNLRFG